MEIKDNNSNSNMQKCFCFDTSDILGFSTILRNLNNGLSIRIYKKSSHMVPAVLPSACNGQQAKYNNTFRDKVH